MGVEVFSWEQEVEGRGLRKTTVKWTRQTREFDTVLWVVVLC